MLTTSGSLNFNAHSRFMRHLRTVKKKIVFAQGYLNENSSNFLPWKIWNFLVSYTILFNFYFTAGELL
jgi:hypothetical protein